MTTTKVINQFGKYIDGKDRDTILNAAYADKGSVIIDDVYIAIVTVERLGDGEEIVKVHIDV